LGGREGGKKKVKRWEGEKMRKNKSGGWENLSILACPGLRLVAYASESATASIYLHRL
jgi:hypothetical protein